MLFASMPMPMSVLINRAVSHGGCAVHTQSMRTTTGRTAVIARCSCRMAIPNSITPRVASMNTDHRGRDVPVQRLPFALDLALLLLRMQAALLLRTIVPLCALLRLMGGARCVSLSAIVANGICRYQASVVSTGISISTTAAEVRSAAAMVRGHTAAITTPTAMLIMAVWMHRCCCRHCSSAQSVVVCCCCCLCVMLS